MRRSFSLWGQGVGGAVRPEIDDTAELFRARQGSRLEGRITRYPQAPADLGHSPPSVPSFLANVFTSYDRALPGEAGTLQGSFGLRYRDHEYADAGLTRLIPGQPLLDLGLSWMAGRYTVSAGLQNLLDRRNFLYGDGTGGGALPGGGAHRLGAAGGQALEAKGRPTGACAGASG